MKRPGNFSTNDTKAIKSHAAQADTDTGRAAPPTPAQTQVLDAENPPLSQSRVPARWRDSRRRPNPSSI